MKIIHYFLGFPPYRSGGLTRYAYDLMLEQGKRGDEVLALWPGRMRPVAKKVKIVEAKAHESVRSLEVINPLPVSLDEGIVDTKRYMSKTDKGVFVEFLRRERPDVIHIHTLMGLYREFVLTARELGICTVFTSHDYFGLCPTVTFYHNNIVCDNDHSCADCIACNRRALSIPKIAIMQSRGYRVLKDATLTKALRRRHRSNFFDEEQPEDEVEGSTGASAEDYKSLRRYYVSILEQIDLIHFNSTVSKDVYGRFVSPNKSKVVSISHKYIKDSRKESSWRWTGVLRVTYLGPAKPFKGYSVIRQAMDRLWSNGVRNIELKVFTPVKDPSPYMTVRANDFAYEDLQDIFNNTDVLVAPSIWYETFGFTVLEALSFGVPVIVSDHVGAKDIIEDGGIVIIAGSVDAMYEALQTVHDEHAICGMRQSVLDSVSIKTWPNHVDEIRSLYCELGTTNE